jgi:hypothetical protein
MEKTSRKIIITWTLRLPILMREHFTAGAVSQDSFNVAMADLMSSLSAILIG